MAVKILYVEDDATLAFLTMDQLQGNGYEVIHADNGSTALEAFRTQEFDLCILDIMLPEIDGFGLARAIRKQNTEIPILFLSAKSLQEDRLKGLRLGADDYLVKPFSMEELMLKIEIFLKRSGKKPQATQSYQIGQFTFHPRNYSLISAQSEFSLTAKEADLLLLFLQNKNQVVKREDILVALWGEDDYFMGRSLDVFISRLRKLLANEEQVKIENLRGIGFRLVI